jgi:cell filamentation protein
MSFGRKARELAEYQRSHYPGTDILVNLLNIRTPALLEQAERMFVDSRMREGFLKEAKVLSYAGLKAIHWHLFQDIYGWAGRVRTYTTGRGAAPFALPEQIEPWLNRRFELLRMERYLVGLNPNDFSDRAAEHVNEINAAHPFIEGNGRTQRVWLRVLAERAGFTLSLAGVNREHWYEASRIGFEEADHTPMAALIRANLSAPK